MQKKYVPDKSKPSAYIFDIDGTLAKMYGRSPYEWDRVGEDELKQSVAHVLWSLQNHGHSIIIFTGRDGVCEASTLGWLCDNGINFDHFAIREEGNTEKDLIIKRRMFDDIKDDYDIRGVFDDRDQVVKMWRDLGLTCFQVAEGDF